MPLQHPLRSAKSATTLGGSEQGISLKAGVAFPRLGAKPASTLRRDTVTQSLTGEQTIRRVEVFDFKPLVAQIGRALVESSRAWPNPGQI